MRSRTNKFQIPSQETCLIWLNPTFLGGGFPSHTNYCTSVAYWFHPSEGYTLNSYHLVIGKIFKMAETKPDVSEVSNFDAAKLKHVVTKEKNTLPSDESKFWSHEVWWGWEEKSCTLQIITKFLHKVLKPFINMFESHSRCLEV